MSHAAAGDAGAEDPRLHRTLAAAPYVLLGLALVLTLATGAIDSGPGRLPALLALMALALGHRVWWQLGAGARGVRVAGFVLNLVLTLALVSLSPFYGVYAFVGYLDAVALFSGPALTPALIAAASLNALAVSGGPAGAYAQPLVFAFLLFANSALAVAMVRVDANRQRTVARLSQALADLEHAQRANAALQSELVDQARASGVMAERARLSREIHDTVAQGLVALLRQIEAAGEASTVRDARVLLDKADRTARESLAEARRAVSALASPRLDDADLPTALAGLLEHWSDHNGTRATFAVEGRPVPLGHDADLLRVCQEALANVARHAGASRVAVTLTYGDDRVTLAVADDGTGCEPGAGGTGHGLRGLRARLLAAGGGLTLTTTQGGGCTLTAAIAT